MQAVVFFVFVVVLGSDVLPLAVSQQDFLALVEWGRTKCGMTLPFDLRQRTTGARDIVTQEPLKGLDNVFIIPEKCLITTAKAIEHPSTYGLFDPRMASQSPERLDFYEKRKFYRSILLPLYLLHLLDEGDEGFFAPYVRNLPKDVNNFVCLWDDEDASLLPFNTLVDLFTICNKIRAVYDDICAIVPAFGQQRSFEDWQSAWLLANSRDLSLTTADGVKHTAIAPFYDFFNHVMEANIRWNFYDDRGGFVVGEVVSDGECHADEDFVVPAGTELTVHYGPFSQSTLVLYYGFTLPCGWETRWRTLLPNRHTVANSESEHYEAPSHMRCHDKLKLRTENAVYELTATRDSADDIAFLESMKQNLLDQQSDDANHEVLSMWLMINRLVTSIEFPLSVSEAGPLLEAATPGSNEYNALNVLIGQWSIAISWRLHATKMIVEENIKQTQLGEKTVVVSDNSTPSVEADHCNGEETPNMCAQQE